jgi:hypothetical protein
VSQDLWYPSVTPAHALSHEFVPVHNWMIHLNRHHILNGIWNKVVRWKCHEVCLGEMRNACSALRKETIWKLNAKAMIEMILKTIENRVSASSLSTGYSDVCVEHIKSTLCSIQEEEFLCDWEMIFLLRTLLIAVIIKHSYLTEITPHHQHNG